MANIVLRFQTVPNATRYKVEYTNDGGVSWLESANSPTTTSPVVVLESAEEGTYQARLTAIGDGTNYTDSTSVTSPEVVVDLPAEQLTTPVIDGLDVQ